METKIHIGRQPIIDINSNIIGYELLFRSWNMPAIEIDDDRFATSKVLTDALNAIGLNEIIGNKTAFINVDKTFLLSPAVESIPADRFVFEILETVVVDKEVVDKVAYLHSQGYLFALDDFDFNPDMVRNFEPLFPYLAIVKVDLLECDPNLESLRSKIDYFKERRIDMLAEKVETRDQYNKCISLGFIYFQGFFFAKPDIVEGKKINPSRLALVQIIKQIITEEPMHLIEGEISRSPEVSINLLRYLNSASFGVRREIASIKQAVSLLGYQPLMKWLTLLFYSVKDDDVNHMEPLLETVLLRAELMKQLALKMRDKQTAEKAYFTGLISMLDTILHRDMKDILEEMSFEKQIKNAVLDKEEFLGKVLKLTECIETGENRVDLDNCNQINIEYDDLAEIVNLSYINVHKALEDMPSS